MPSKKFRELIGSLRKRNEKRPGGQETQLQIERLEPRMMLNGDAGEVLFRAGFEDADVATGQFEFFRSVSGFTATKQAVEVQNNHPSVGPASEGQKHLELDGTNGIFVDIIDTQAAQLQLEVDYSARADAEVRENEIEVLWKENVVATLSANGIGQTSTQFNSVNIELPIENGSTAGRLEFRSKFSGGRGFGGLIDNVNVTAKLNPLAIEDIADQQVQVGSTLSVDADILPPNQNEPTVNFQLVKAPVGATINAQTGLFQWIASEQNIEATENRGTETVIGPPQQILFAGFEDVNVANGEFGFFRRTSGFDVTGPPVEVQNNHPAVGPASQGSQHIELDGRIGIAQAVDTVQGDRYELKFDFSPRKGADAVTNAIQILWDGKVIREVTADGRGNGSTDFNTITVNLSEFSGSSTRLEFRSKDAGTRLGFGGLIDNVRITRREVVTVK